MNFPYGPAMRLVPERSPFLQIVSVFGGFFVGPWAALQAGLYLVPESGLVHSVGVLAFALIFVGGTLLWTGVGIASVVVSGLWRLARGRRPGPPSLQPSDRIVPPGYRAYVFLGPAAGAAVGLLAGVATDLSIVGAFSVWTILGTLYGLLLWAAAHHGYLPFFEPQ